MLGVGAAQLQLTSPTTVNGGQTFFVDVSAIGISGTEAFGFELRFNPIVLTFNSVQKGSLTQSFDKLLSNDLGNGVVRIGGYGLGAIGSSTGTLCRVSFTAKTGVEDETILHLRSTVDFPQAPSLDPVRISILRESLANNGMSIAHKRGRRNMNVIVPIIAFLPTGNTFRGAAVRLFFDTVALQFVDTAKGSAVPSSYNVTSQTPAPGTVDLTLTTSGSQDLVDGEFWTARLKVKVDAPLEATAINISSEESYFVDFPNGAQIALGTTRNGSVTVHPRGDANRTGNVTVADILTILLGILSNVYADEFTDCNKTGATTVDDIVCAIDALFAN